MAMISYGYFGDLMAHSEQLRWLGPRRYDVSGAITFLRNKSYKGVISFVEEVDQSFVTDPRKISECCNTTCKICGMAEATLGKTERETRTKVKKIFALEMFIFSVIWIFLQTIEGKFLVVTSAVMLCACKLTPRGLSPSAHLGDGQV